MSDSTRAWISGLILAAGIGVVFGYCMPRWQAEGDARCRFLLGAQTSRRDSVNIVYGGGVFSPVGCARVLAPTDRRP